MIAQGFRSLSRESEAEMVLGRARAARAVSVSVLPEAPPVALLASWSCLLNCVPPPLSWHSPDGRRISPANRPAAATGSAVAF